MSSFFLGIFIFGIFISIGSESTYGQTNTPNYLPFQALITDGSDNPLTSYTPASFMIRIIEPASTCAIYQESQAVTTDNKGIVALLIGNGSTPTYATGVGSFKNVFQNNSLVIGAGNCAGGGGPGTTLTPAIGRSIQFSIDGGATWSAAVSMGSVPFAFYAENAGQALDTTNVAGIASSTYTPLVAGAASDASGLHHHDTHNDVRYGRLGAATNNFSGVLDTSGQFGVGTTTPAADIDVDDAA